LTSFSSSRRTIIALSLNDVRAQRFKTVESNCGICGRIGTRAFDQNFVSALQGDWKWVVVLLVKNISAVAGRSSYNTWRVIVSILISAKAVADGFVHRFSETAELANVEVNPTD